MVLEFPDQSEFKRKQLQDQVTKDGNSLVDSHKFIKENLNKITAENFEVICRIILDQINSEKEATEFVELVVSKSWKEFMFSECYVSLLSRGISQLPHLKDHIMNLVYERIKEQFFFVFSKMNELFLKFETLSGEESQL